MPWILLFIIVSIGFALRVCIGLDWDAGQHLHPDERFLTMVVSAIQFPSGVGEYFDSAKSPLSPYNNNYGFFVYGTFPLFLTKLVGIVFDKSAYDAVHFVGRILSALFDLGSVVLLFLLGSRLYGRKVGIVAAALLSCTVLHIQLSHFFGVETYAAFFVLLTFYLGTHLPQFLEDPTRGIIASQKPRPLFLYIVIGITFGLALASKISAMFFLPILGLMLIGDTLRQIVKREDLSELLSRRSILKYLRVVGNFIVVVIIAAICFRIFQPYAFSGPSFFNFTFNPKFLANMQEVSGMMKGADMPPAIQWVDRPAFWFSFYNMVVWGMGPVLGLSCWIGVILCSYQVVFKGGYKHLHILLWALLWFLYQSTQFVKAGRYLSLAYPFFVLLGAYFLVWLGQQISRSNLCKGLSASGREWVSRTPAIFGVLATLFWAVAFVSIYSRPHPRVAASYWIYDNIPCGATISAEHWDDGLPLRVGGKDGFGGCYKGVEFNHYYPDNPDKLNDTLKKLVQVEYIVLSSNRLYLSIPRLPRRFPYTIEYYNMLFSGDLGFDLVHSQASYPRIFGINFPTDNAEEPFTVYDQPRVFIFKKSPRFNIELIKSRLSKFPPGIMEPLIK